MDHRERLRLRQSELGAHEEGDHHLLMRSPLLHGLGVDVAGHVLTEETLLSRERQHRVAKTPPAAVRLGLGCRVYLSASIPYPDYKIFLILAEPDHSGAEGTLGDIGQAGNRHSTDEDFQKWYDTWTFPSPLWRELLCSFASSRFPNLSGRPASSASFRSSRASSSRSGAVFLPGHRAAGATRGTLRCSSLSGGTVTALQDLVVIGTTYDVDPQTAPSRMPPVYRNSRDGKIFVSLSGMDGEDMLVEEDEDRIRQWKEDGGYHAVGPFQAAPGHLLVLLPDGPAYLPEPEFRAKLHYVAERALEDAKHEAELERWEETLNHLLVAARATPERVGLWALAAELANRIGFPDAAEGYLADGRTQERPGRQAAARDYPELHRILFPQSWKSPVPSRQRQPSIFEARSP